MADKCIGSLSLDLSKLKSQISDVNKALEKIGTGAKIDLSKDIAKEVKKQLENVTKEIESGTKKIQEATKKTSESLEKMGETKGKRSEEAKVQQALRLYEKLYNAKSKVYELETKGQQGSTAYARATNDIQKYNMALDNLGEKFAKLARQREEYDRILDRNVSETNAAYKTAENKSIDESLKKYEEAYIRATKAQTEFNNAIANGQVKEGTAVYDEMSKSVQKFAEEAEKAGQNLSQSDKEIVESSEKAQQAVTKLNESIARRQDATDNHYLTEIKQTYFELTDAIKNYNIAKKEGDTDGMAAAQTRIDAAMQEVAAIQEAVNASNMEAGAKQQVLNVIQQCTTAERQHAAEIQNTASSTNEVGSAVQSILTRYLSLMAIIRTMSSLFKNMVEYVSEYSNKMSEIQMITLKSNSEVDALAKTYRDMAKDMSVSSLEMADAAIYFTRQGLGAEQIEDRLKNTTQYAKAANLEFETAAELITAVVNSMDLVEQEAEDGRTAAQRVADVFLKVGDNAATSGQEIGEAMQKAAASAGTFGVSFEWLASAIATVSETTRQEARTIGTAFNTIIARLHQIKQTGYNQEDETKINDIAKALANIDVALMDNEGNWRDMEDIWGDVAEKWDELDGKTKSYIATTMAGVKQQNVFFAAMNDMSKSAEEGGRFMELYGLAMDSAGTASEKYGVYLDSVAASQERLKVAQEGFYAMLDDSVIKGFNNAFAGFINMITEAAEATHGLSIALPVLAGAFVAVAVAISNATTISTAFATVWQSHPVLLIITAVAAGVVLLTSAVSGLVTAVETQEEKFNKANKTLEESQTKLKSYLSIQEQTNEMFSDLGDSKTNKTLEDYSGLLDKISGVSDTAAAAVVALKDGFISQKEAAEILNAELEKYIENEKQVSAINQYNKVKNTDMSTVSMLTDLMGSGIDDIQKFMKFVSGDFSDLFDENTWSRDIGVIREPIMELVHEYEDQFEGIFDSEKDRLEAIAMRLWTDLLGGSSSINDYLTKQANAMINETIQSISLGLEDVDTSLIKGALTEKVFGPDGILSFDEAQNYQEVIAQFMKDFISNGFKIDPDDLIGYIGTDLFGNFFGEYFGEQLESLQNSAFYQDYADKIAHAYAELLSAGFSRSDLYDLYSDIDLTGWVDAVEIMAERMKEKLQSVFGEEFLSEYDVGAESFISYMEELDVATLKLIEDLTSGGASFEQIQNLFYDSFDELGNFDATKFSESIRQMSETMRLAGQFKNEYGEDFLGIFTYDYAQGIQNFTSYLDTLDVSTLRFIDDLTKSGVSLKQIQDAFLDSYMENGEQFIPEDFVARLQELESLNAEAPKEFADALKDIVAEMKDSSSEIDSLNGALEKLKSGKGFSIKEMFELAGAHPEFAALVGDIDAFEAAVDRLKKAEGEKVFNNIQKILLDSADVMKNSPFAEMMTEDIDTLRKYMDSLEVGSEAYDKVSQYLAMATAQFLAASDSLDSIPEDKLENLTQTLSYMQQLKGGNFDISIKPTIDVSALKDVGWAEAIFSKSYRGDYSQEGGAMYWNQKVIVTLSPTTQDGDPLSPEALENYMKELFEKSSNIDELLENDELGLVIDVTAVADGESFEDAEARVSSLIKLYEKIVGFFTEQEEKGKEESWLEKQAKAAAQAVETNWAATNNYIEQIQQLRTALSDRSAPEEVMAIWNQIPQSIQEGMLKTFPELAQAILDYQNALEEAGDYTQDFDLKLDTAAKTLLSTLNLATTLNDATHFTETAKAVEQLSKGLMTVDDAYKAYSKDVQKCVKANNEIINNEKKLQSQSKLTANDVTALADVLGKPAEEIANNYPEAVKEFQDLISETGELQSVLSALQAMEVIKITGVGEGDFSALETGLISVENLAEETVRALEQTGHFKKEKIELEQEGAVFNPLLGWIRSLLSVGQEVLVPTDGNKFGGADVPKGGGGGGGGGGGNKKSEVTTMVEGMDKILKQYDDQLNYLKALQNYYDTTGDSQKVIETLEKQKKVLEDQNKEIEKNIQKLEEQIRVKKEELAATTEGTDAYEKLKAEIEELEAALLKYKTQQVEVKTAMESTTQAIQAQAQAARQAAIDIKNLIQQALEARDSAARARLDATVAMEDKIRSIMVSNLQKEKEEALKAIRDEYGGMGDVSGAGGSSGVSEELEALKAEREEVEKTTKAKLEALQEEYKAFEKVTKLKQDALAKEKQLLSDQLALRKKQNEEDDKQARLAELEAKYQRIIADPTRAKEAMEIQEDINNLRKEMAWTTAEDEVKAKQDTIDKEKEQLQKELDLRKEMYEDDKKAMEDHLNAFKKAIDKQIEELQKLNDSLNSSTNVMQSMMEQQLAITEAQYDKKIEDTDALNKKISKLLKKTDEEIIAWLKENDEDYQKASKKKKKQMVEDWQKMIDEMRGKEKDYTEEIEKIFAQGQDAVIALLKKYLPQFKHIGAEQAAAYLEEWNKMFADLDANLAKPRNPNSGSGGSGGSDNSSAARGHGWEFYYKGKKYSNRSPLDDYGDANLEAYHRIAALGINPEDVSGLTIYAKGGLATSTGPAWLDGSEKLPERVLSPYQTQLFETMVAALERMSTVYAPTMPNFSNMETGGNSVSVGDIIVNVDNLDTDDDYEELAKKVCEIIMNRIGRRSVVGGLRIGSF